MSTISRSRPSTISHDYSHGIESWTIGGRKYSVSPMFSSGQYTLVDIINALLQNSVRIKEDGTWSDSDMYDHNCDCCDCNGG